MHRLFPVIDIHSHLLPNIDDGSRSVEQSVGVLEMFVEQGVTDVICTPHIKATQVNEASEVRLAERQAAFDELRPQVPEGMTLHLGFEIMLDEPLKPEALTDYRFSLAGSRYFLVEFSTTVAVDVASKVIERIAAHAVPLVAHPERYESLSVKTAGVWRDAGARLQVDATTLSRKTGRGKKARGIVSAGLADLLAADNHGSSRSMANGKQFLKTHGAGRVVTKLTETNPRAILENWGMERVEAVKLGGGWADGVMAFFRG